MDSFMPCVLLLSCLVVVEQTALPNAVAEHQMVQEYKDVNGLKSGEKGVHCIAQELSVLLLPL